MSDRFKVSVIIPVYNAEKYIRACLDSIVNQTLKEIEIICVDDGSEDNSVEIIKSYKQNDNRFIILCQEHQGGGAARNIGLKNAQGEYLSFLDADDYFEHDMLEKIYAYCKKNDADIGVYGVACYHQATGAENHEPSGLRKEFLPDKDVFCWRDFPKYIFNSFHNWPWNKLFKREFVIQKKLKFQEIHRTNDLLFVNKALILADRIIALEEDLVHYRIQISDNCQSSNNQYPLDFYKALLKLKQFLIEESVYAAVKQSYVNLAADSCVANLVSLELSKEHKLLFDNLKTGIMNKLDIEVDALALYYSFNHNTVNILQQVSNLNYELFLKERLGWYKTNFTESLFNQYRKDLNIKKLTDSLEELSDAMELIKQNKYSRKWLQFRRGKNEHN